MSKKPSKSGALAHLIGHYNDSDVESNPEDNDGSSDSPSNVGMLRSVSPNQESSEEENYSSMEADENSSNQVEDNGPPLSPISFHRSLSGQTIDETLIPSDFTQQKPSDSLVEKINRLHERTLRGQKMIESIEKQKDFRNPSIYEKLVSFCEIDELGSNFPPETYDPHKWSAESYYDELAKKQKDLMDALAKQKKERTKVEILTGTKKPTHDSHHHHHHHHHGEERKKTKWDNPPQPSNPILAIRLPNQSILNSTKTTSHTNH